MKKHFKIALAGNPNCGKTTIFNALTGARQHVGNYPGVTVESKSGSFSIDGMEIELVDLPGIYSLSSSSPEEAVAFNELTSEGIDLILNVIDSSIPNRSMYLTTQLAELHIPMMLAFNMSDDAQKKGMRFDIPKLEKYFGSPIVMTVGRSRGGVDDLVQKLGKTLKELENHGSPMLSYGQDIDDSIAEIAKKIDAVKPAQYKHIPSRFFAIKLLESDNCTMKISAFQSVWKTVSEQIKHLQAIHAIDNTPTFLADKRYAMIAGACRDAISMSGERRREISEKIDAVVTNKFVGLPLFFAVMYATFWFTFTCADPFMGWIEDAFGWLGEMVDSLWGDENLQYLKSLVTDGIIGGVGGVIVFLPNILFMFLALSLLEESGYMARAAFIMDGIMRRFGLQGKSFVPLILGFGCNVPAIMGTRSIESERDRKTTIMIMPFMSCGARLPIYALIIPAFFVEKYQALVMWLMYLIGIAVALVAAKVLKSTVFKGDGEVYLMELPPYRMPTLRSLILHMWDKGKVYLHKAGTIILATSVILFLCNTLPEKVDFAKDYDALIAKVEESKTLDKEAKETQVAELENERSAESMEYTISGRVGKFFEPVFKPIGFDWKLTTASIGALAAKEVFVSQLGILYAEGEADEESDTLREKLVKNYTPLQGFCIMMFCLLSIPCLATLAVIKRELNSWKAPVFEAFMLFAIAYVLTLIVYQIGSIFNIGNALMAFIS